MKFDFATETLNALRILVVYADVRFYRIYCIKPTVNVTFNTQNTEARFVTFTTLTVQNTLLPPIAFHSYKFIMQNG